MYLSPYKANLINTFQTIKWIDYRRKAWLNMIASMETRCYLSLKDHLFSYLKLKRTYLKLKRTSCVTTDANTFVWKYMNATVQDNNTNVYRLNSIQFNSKKVFKDGDPVILQLIFPGAIQTCKQIQQFSIHIYKTTQVHRTNTGKHNVTFHTKTYP